MAKRPVRVPTHTFRAVWPIIEGQGTAETDAELILQALGDLPAVARRHNTKITGDPRACITEGRLVSGSAGHKYVVVVEAPAEALPVRGYHHQAPQQVAS
ncbi:hypothetical protein NG701_17050 [Pseudarthrobacter sp. HLT3-5]|uniref:hypothetical protein n=1 Tax=Pseudarthrobacter cellobiosi TaxID=2953654 RepID=UPI00208E7533|nr:hypothetical protein [Pseudarthrobacter sp. HLT3-5]MCO4276111.1 hypothetical protein [Pseudarthrobacter sp. HLT3-5]